MIKNAVVIGCGYLGRFHAQKYSQNPKTNLVGVIDLNLDNAKKLANELNTQAFQSIEQIDKKIDCASIVVPTTSHFNVAKDYIEKGIHVLVEKPLCETSTQAKELLKLAKKKNIVLQVGHQQRFHPAFQMLASKVDNPLFIETTRIAPYKPRGIDVDVVFDLLVHDIDIVMSLMNKKIDMIQANGAKVFTDKIDITSSRIQFENGSTASLIASRVSGKTDRKIRVFQQKNYMVIDLYNKSFQQFVLSESQTNKFHLITEQFENSQCDEIYLEIDSFLDCIRDGLKPVVSGEDGLRNLEIAEKVRSEIWKNIDLNNQYLKKTN